MTTQSERMSIRPRTPLQTCEGYNVAGRWVDCDRPMPHVHGIADDMVRSPFTRAALAGRLPAKVIR